MNHDNFVRLSSHGALVCVLGWVVMVLDRKRYPPPFSVRTGARREWRIRRFGIQVLSPNGRGR
jgi:hypothetical protein